MEDDNMVLDTPPSSVAASDADKEVKKTTVIEISNFSVDYHMFKRSRKKPFGEFEIFNALKTLDILLRK